MVALVTGGGRGIGRGIALRLAAAGWTVAVSSRSVDQLQETVRQSEGRILAVTADMQDPACVKDMILHVEQKLGPVDLLVNNAGVGGPIGQFWANDPNDWWHAQEVNFRGPMLCCHHVLPGMIARKSGRIVNIASMAGCQAVPELSAYVASKTALIRLTEQLAMELQPYGVVVFAIHPGAVRTAMVEQAREKVPLLQALLDAHEVTPNAAADLILFLASGQGDMLTGRFLSVDDDAAAIASRAPDVLGRDLLSLRVRPLSL